MDFACLHRFDSSDQLLARWCSSCKDEVSCPRLVSTSGKSIEHRSRKQRLLTGVQRIWKLRRAFLHRLPHAARTSIEIQPNLQSNCIVALISIKRQNGGWQCLQQRFSIYLSRWGCSRTAWHGADEINPIRFLKLVVEVFTAEFPCSRRNSFQFT